MVKTQNIDTALLEKAIENSGLRINYILDQLGISRQSFDRKRKNVDSFRQSEVYVLCDLLKLDNAQKKKIFFPECSVISDVVG